MPPRLNKRQQRELEELSALGGGSGPPISDEESPNEELPGKGTSRVAFLTHFLAEEQVNEDQGEGEEEEEPSTTSTAKSRKKKKGKKKTEASQTPATLPLKNEKKAAKRAKAKEKKAGDDELEQALAELSLKYPNQAPSTSTSAITTPRPLPANTLSTLLAVSLAHLDPAAEMRKFFGSKVVRSSASTSGPSSNSRKRAGVTQKSHLTRPQPGWWSASQREGLAIRSLGENEVKDKAVRHGWGTESIDGERWWTIDYSQRYKSMTKLFIQAVMSGHPDALWEVQRKLPWHADNLLQLAEVYRHREEYAQAVDFVDRALFTYERAFIGAFTFTAGTSRMDFDRVENRPFFLAVHRQIADLQRRGCTRTAFEFARLLYSLDPWADPHGALFHLDLLAIKGGMGEWVLGLFDYFESLRSRNTWKGRLDPSVFPGMAYARALAMNIIEGGRGSTHEKSTQALSEAMNSFPEVVPLLADKIDVSLPQHIRGHQSFKVSPDAGSLTPAAAALHCLAHMYTSHSSAPWKDPSHAAWFLSTAISTFPPSLPTSSLPSTERRSAALSLFGSTETQRTLARHILVLEGIHRRLLGYLPREFGQDAGLACDPLPPFTSLSNYNKDYFEGVEDVWSIRAGGRGAQGGVDDDERLLAMAIPDQEIRGRVAQFLQGLRGQFPGGLREMLDRLGPEAVEDVLGQVQGMVLAQDEAHGEGMMPGAFAIVGDGVADAPAPVQAPVAVPVPPVPPALPEPQQDQRVEGADSMDEEDEEAEETSTIQRVLRNVLGRFWGGAVPAGDDTSEDDDEGGIRLNSTTLLRTQSELRKAMNILIIGGSRNIGYYASLRFLEAGHTVTFLLRNLSTFDNDNKIQNFITTKKAYLTKGDALVRDDVKQAWAIAAGNADSGLVDLLLFTVGGVPKFKLREGFVISPPDLVTRSLLNALSTLPSPYPKIITISSTGLTHSSHAALPLPLKPLYGYLLASPHRDKVGAERLVSHLAGWKWNSNEDGEPAEEVLDTAGRWKSTEGLPPANSLGDNVLIIRPALLTDGECLAEKKDGKRTYRVSEDELGGWTVSRQDVAHFVADTALNRWGEFKGKRVSIAY
ncbi:hypothetical protein H0H87_006975 [Tephrocybe sp. NHM501043]|nr:hypothetical protein H0H87_006975 [Tephrocybe sp. NHM501043]